ncbi:MAG: TonB-dependent receptor [Pseudomonadota bacterium]
MRWVLLSLVALNLLWGSSLAAKEPEREYETVVTPSRDEENPFQSPRAVEILPKREMSKRAPASTPEAMESASSVNMQRTNTGGGAPIVRGLLGQHVLSLVDGVRLNNAITRYGPNQSLNTVDNFQLSRIEIVRGPGAVLYGSDALGGAINLITSRPTFDPKRAWDYSFDLLGRFGTADTSGVGHAAAEGHVRQFGLRIGGSLKRFGDLSGGSDTGTQRFTGYSEQDAYTAGTWIIDDSNSLRFSYAAVRQNNAPRTDQATPRSFLIFSDQFRDLGTLNYEGIFDEAFINRVRATLAYHYHRELREQFTLDKDMVERERDNVGQLGALLSLQSIFPYNRLNYGVDFYQDWVSSSAENERISVSEQMKLPRGRYPDDSLYTQLALYALDRISIGSKLAFDLGGRVNAWWVSIPEDLDPENGFAAMDTGNAAVVGSLHARYLVGSFLNLVAGVSQGYRAPNIDDYSALGCSSSTYDIPNPDLSPEQSVTAEAGLKIDLDLIVGIKGSAFYYFTYLDDVIVRMPATLQTASGTVSQFQCGTTAEGLPRMCDVQKRDNANAGRVHGVEFDLAVTFFNNWTVFGWLNWTRGNVDLPDGSSEPMRRIPPLNGFAGIGYRSDEDIWFAELAVRWAAPQSRLGSGDKTDARICSDGPIGCEGTDGYATLWIRGWVRFDEYIRLVISFNNITNETYRVHSSGIDGPGISAIIGLDLFYP